MRLLILFLICFVCLSALNYGFYDHRLTSLEQHSKAAVISKGVNEPFWTLSIIGNDEKIAVQEHHDFVDREIGLTAIACVGIILLYKTQKGTRNGSARA